MQIVVVIFVLYRKCRPEKFILSRQHRWRRDLIGPVLSLSSTLHSLPLSRNVAEQRVHVTDSSALQVNSVYDQKLRVDLCPNASTGRERRVLKDGGAVLALIDPELRVQGQSMYSATSELYN